MIDIGKNLEAIKTRIEKAAADCGRDPNSIRLVSVSKTKTVDEVRNGIEAGVTILGENYIQEARDKITKLSEYPVSWHFIGHLQSNKAKYAVKLFDLIHSVESLKLARELDKQAKKVDKVQDILFQVNIGNDPAKSGTAAEDTIRLIRECRHFENISIKGLMTMPPFFDAPDKVRPYFIALAQLRDQIRAEEIPNVHMEELSMGMTGDFEVAIECGATLIRVGTAIFGERR